VTSLEVDIPWGLGDDIKLVGMRNMLLGDYRA
jgi:hypothetical protein